MKKYLFHFAILIFVLTHARTAPAQNIGIGTTTPRARFHVVDSSVLFSVPLTLPLNSGSTPVSGPGTRFMWYAQKGAFRAGSVSNNNWDADSIGLRSISFGNTSKASGENSLSSGSYTIASGFASTALGEYTTASGFISTATGAQTKATNDFCFASGFQSSATGYASTAMGYNVVAGGGYSTAMGTFTTASGNASIAIGSNCIASGDFSIAAGVQCRAKAWGGATLGAYNDDSDNPIGYDAFETDRIFQIGNGYYFPITKSNALTVLRNGRTGIGVLNPQQTLSLKGGMNIDQTNQNHGTIDNNILRFGDNSGEGIGSARASGDNVWGLDFYTASLKRMVITNGTGNIGINTSNPSEKLEVVGNVKATSFITSSDARLKKNILPIESALGSLLKLNGYRYQWKDTRMDSATQIGLIAQEVQKQFPELVKENSEGELGVNYSGMIPLLLNAVKEQQKLIQDQEKENKKQQEEIEELKNEMKKLRETKKS